MPKVTFVKHHKPKGDDPSIPTYKAGESYDLASSYAEKYKARGYAVDYVAPVAVVEPEPGVAEPETLETAAVEEAPASQSQFNRGGRRR